MREKRLFKDAMDKAILKLMQGDLPLTSNPYAKIADYYSVSEEEILDRVAGLKERGAIRKMNALLCHTKAGYTTNVLSAWTATPKEGESEEDALHDLQAELPVESVRLLKTEKEWKKSSVKYF